MKLFTTTRFTLIGFFALSLCYAHANETIVVVSKDEKLGKELLENWSKPSEKLQKSFVFSKMPSGRAAFDRRLISGENPDWYGLAMQVALRQIGKKAQRLTDLNPAEQSAMRKLFLGGPFNRKQMESTLENPDFKFSFNFSVKADFAAGSRSLTDQFTLLPDGFADDVVTPGLTVETGAKAAENREKFEAARLQEVARAPEFVFCKGLSDSPLEATTLKREALGLLEGLQKLELDRLSKLRREAIDKAISDMQDSGEKWDGKKDISAKNLSAEMMSMFESNFGSRSSNYGFSNTDASLDFFRGATIKNPRFDLMLVFGGTVPGRGPHLTSFSLSSINP